MGMLFGLAPWIVYWVLVGNVPFAAAVLVALAVAAAGLGWGVWRAGAGSSLISLLSQRF